MANEKKEKKSQELSEVDLERLMLLQQANQKKGRQLSIGIEDGRLKEIDELRELIGKDFENPEEKYSLYYTGIRKLLMEYLPKGKEYKEMRDIIYDEKNIFLNLGKRKCDHKGIRKSDGRMTYQPVMNEILDLIVTWVAESQNPFDIYRAFYYLNEKYEYQHEIYDESTGKVAGAMLSLGE